MTASFLTADLGNSACKLVRWELDSGQGGPARAAASARLAPGPALAEATAAWVAAGPLCAGAALASVAAERAGAELAERLADLVAGSVLAPPAHGLRVLCREPQTIGQDRLFAARGALELCGAPVIVVDAGTALTVDALLPADGAGGGFAGGAIAPGPHLLAAALARGAALLFAVEPDPDAPALGLDTAAALRAGASVGFVGAARELVARVADEAGAPGAPLVLTGGARRYLTRPGTFGTRAVREEELLVHVGLLAAARERA